MSNVKFYDGFAKFFYLVGLCFLIVGGIMVNIAAFFAGGRDFDTAALPFFMGLALLFIMACFVMLGVHCMKKADRKAWKVDYRKAKVEDYDY